MVTIAMVSIRCNLINYPHFVLFLQGYAELVYMFADLQQLTAAEVFVGTFTSNVGRLVYLRREASGSKLRESSISLDDEWHPGR